MRHPNHIGSAAAALFILASPLAGAPTVVPDFEITDEVGQSQDAFGSSLAHGTGYLAIGSPDYNSPALYGGKVTIERPIWVGTPDDPFAAEGAIVETIEHADAGQNAKFGFALAASGDRLFIGSPKWRLGETASTRHGAVFVYDVPQHQLASSTLLQMIFPGAPAGYDEFGASVAIGLDDYGTLWLAVGSPGRNNDAGAVWVYQQDDSTNLWTLQQIIQPAGLLAGDEFGAAVALDGDLLVIGAPGTNGGEGHVYIRRFWADSGTWDTAHDVAGSATTATGQFGSAVDVWQYFVLIGAPDGAGHVSLWEDVSTAGLFNHLMDLSPDDWTDITNWGYAVAIEVDRAVIGSPGGNNGTAAVFRDLSSGNFQLVAMLDGNNLDFQPRHGKCVALDNGTAWVGAPDAGAGVVSRWDVSRTPGCPGDLNFDFIVNSMDLNALLGDWMSTDDSDLTGDGETDIWDLLNLLEHWGSCL